MVECPRELQGVGGYELMNVKVTVEYDGTDFHGWQRQPDLRTVQGSIEDAIRMAVRQDVTVYGAGRTDAGVHACGQVFNVSVETTMTVDTLAKAISANLPKDIHIRSAEIVPAAFHARYDAAGRAYHYYIRTEPTALWRRYFHIIHFTPDLRAMIDASRSLLGANDFTSFTPMGSHDGSARCCLKKLDIKRYGKVITVECSANRFLRNMVRTIVGTLLEVGRGKMSPSHMRAILEERKRSAAGPTLPPTGLFLFEVTYER
jgi:tRNA pseudouridine38-40 synthase